jgi:hypothetical protein
LYSHAREVRAVKPKLSGITVEDVFFLSAMHIQWPELTEHLNIEQDAMRKANGLLNNLLNPGIYRPWPPE